MHVVIAGGHGKIALLLAEVLAERGHRVDGLIRNPAHSAEITAAGATPVLFDLEHSTSAEAQAVLKGADAVVFAAGAGPGSGAARKYAVDKGGSVLLAAAAEELGVRRFVQISTINAGLPVAPGGDEVWAAYLDAKTQAEADLRARDLDWTILRPGRLVDTPGGNVRLGTERLQGSIARADVAVIVADLLTAPRTIGATLELVAGETPVDQAVAELP
ncbi:MULTISPECIES: SDR family oxidoreductase [unclassified Nocardia]|uniref:SDR family oxidoreductase n=1 Tax=unclassified Nocardia TaxID=2637762 RepID=UPI001CE42713|nr:MULTISPECIES: SDR family oxidoreductase [unclassified Nocardia]